MILVIDDDPHIREYIKCIVEALGYEVAEAGSGDDALKLYAEMPIKLVITDIVMPGTNGFQCIGEIRKLSKDMPIIAMTSDIHGHADDYLLMCQKIGSNLVMYKPLTVEKVTASVKELYPL